MGLKLSSKKQFIFIVTSCFLFLIFMANIFSKTVLAQDEYIVQVMSVKDQEIAEKEVGNFIISGIPSFSRSEDLSEKGIWFRVFLGPFNNKNEALAAAEQLKTQNVISEYILRVDKAKSPSLLASDTFSQPENRLPEVKQDNTQQPLQVPKTSDLPEPSGTAEKVVLIFEPGEETPTKYTVGDGEIPKTVDDKAANTGFGTPPMVLMPPTDGSNIVRSDGKLEVPQLDPSRSGLENEPSVSAEKILTPPIVAGHENSENINPIPEVKKSATPSPTTAGMKIKGFVSVVDLSSSMRRLAPCQGYVKEELSSSVLRKINHRIPNHPYQATLRVFGYKKSWTRKDYTTNYYGLESYDQLRYDEAIARLVAADSVSPFGWALLAANDDLALIMGPKAVLMFADFEVNTDDGGPVNRVTEAVKKHGSDLKVYTFYVTRSSTAVRLANKIAEAGNGKAYDLCQMISNESAFEEMMLEIFGPADLPPCSDQDGDGVCDEQDWCPNTPKGAPVDSRGCWIAAYSQFFDFDKAEVKSAFLPRIQNAAEILQANSNIADVTIAGHTDNVGTEKYNMDLGERRAEAVKKILISNGVEESRLKIKSYGMSESIADNNVEEGRAKNRRVEFHVGDYQVKKKPD